MLPEPLPQPLPVVVMFPLASNCAQPAPCPVSCILEPLSAVNVPAAGVVPPIAPGAAHAPLSSVVAFKVPVAFVMTVGPLPAVMVLVAMTVVNLPAAAVVPPMAGGTDRFSAEPNATDVKRLPLLDRQVIAPVAAKVQSPETALLSQSAPDPWSMTILPAVAAVIRPNAEAPSACRSE